MAYSVVKELVSLVFRDERDEQRGRVIEFASPVVTLEDDMVLFNTVSNSIVASFSHTDKQTDPALSPAAGSEVRDTARLYFRLASQDRAHFDIVDPHIDLFIGATGTGATIIKDKATLAAGAVGSPELALNEIIDHVLAGDYLISDGETPEAYLEGRRV